MKTKSKYNEKVVIYSNNFDEDEFQSWVKEMREDCGYLDEDEDTLRSWYWDNINDAYNCQCNNLNKQINGYIIALGSRWSHYGAICGNGRTGVKMIGDRLSDILKSNADSLECWAQNYNVHGSTSDHDGCWNMIFRVCKSKGAADRLVYGNYSHDEIMKQTTSLYPYIAKVYGWPSRGSKK